MKMKSILFILSLYCLSSFGQPTLAIDASGQKLRSFYLTLDVENKWLPGHHVNWETGEIDDPNAETGTKTHCSRFAAAASKRLGIHLLQPPEKGRGSLANAQFDWLFSSTAHDSGWYQIKDSLFYKSQSLANKGYEVVIVYRNPNPKKSGHIALVFPSYASPETLAQQGPYIIQAGRLNSSSLNFATGFEHHITSKKLSPDEFAFFYNIHKME